MLRVGRSVGMLSFILTCMLVLTLPAVSGEQVVGKTFFTIVNIWYEKADMIESTNYHKGKIIPIGTKVKIVRVNEGQRPDRYDIEPQLHEKIIQFEVQGGNSYRLVLKKQHARDDMTIWDLFRQHFSENDPTAEGGAFRSLNAEEQKRVRDGKIRPGMCKAAVIMAYGYPPSHKTQSLAMDKWIYWENRFKTRTVLFKDDRVAASEGKSQQDTKQSSISECIKACKENTSRTPEQCFDACNKQM